MTDETPSQSLANSPNNLLEDSALPSKELNTMLEEECQVSHHDKEVKSPDMTGNQGSSSIRTSFTVVSSPKVGGSSTESIGNGSEEVPYSINPADYKIGIAIGIASGQEWCS